MPPKLEPVHFWACVVDGKEVASATSPDPCSEHNAGWYDMGYRVGEGAANYSWYSTLEQALKDRRCNR